MALFVIIVMTSSVIGLMWGGSDDGNSIEYKNYKLIRQNNGQWMLNTEQGNLIFDYFPSEIEGLNFSGDIVQRTKTFEVDITYDENSSFAEAMAYFQYMVEQNLGKSNVYVRKGFSAESSFNVPVITCKDATSAVPVIYLKKAEKINVYLDGDCIIAEAGSEGDILKIKDWLVYSYLGVI